METPRWRSVVRSALRFAGALLACLGASWQLLLQARLYLGRVGYPWDVEWLEGSALYQAYRVAHGLPTYAPPKDGYLPLMHPPLYPTALGLLGKVVGLDYGMARTVSLLFFLTAVVMIGRSLVRHQQGRLEGWVLAVFMGGCAAAGAPLFETFYDLVREDVMAVWLCVLGALVADTAPRMRPRRLVLLALILTAIVYTRLPAVFFPVWITLFVYGRHPRSGVLLALLTTAFCGLALVAIQYTSKGWYWMYTVTLLQDQVILPARFLYGVILVAKFAPFVVPVVIVTPALAVARRLSVQSVLWVGMFAASIPASLLPFAKVGGFSNDFMPVCFMLAPATAFVVSDVLRALARHPRVALAVQTCLFAGSAAFMVIRTYDFKRFVPTADHFRRAAVINAKLAGLQGGVLLPRHPFAPIHDGHTTLQWSDMPYLDMVWSGFGDLNLGAYIDKSKAKWAVVSGTEVPLAGRELSARYQLEGPIGEAPSTVIGERSQMKYLLRLADDEKGGHVLFDFEKDLTGWTTTGDAWQLTPPRPKWQSPIYGAVGGQLANSFHPTKGDTATGTLTSPKFVIDRPRMSLRIGGWKPGTRVELRVGGRVERKASGIWEYNENMTHVVWEMRELQGREAELMLIDQDSGSWGHVTVDHVVLY